MLSDALVPVNCLSPPCDSLTLATLPFCAKHHRRYLLCSVSYVIPNNYWNIVEVISDTVSSGGVPVTVVASSVICKHSMVSVATSVASNDSVYTWVYDCPVVSVTAGFVPNGADR